MPDLPARPAAGGATTPAPAGRRPTGWGAAIVVVAAVVAVVGLALAVGGSMAASRADTERDDARAQLPGARDERDTAVAARDAAEARLSTAEAAVGEVESRGDLALAASDDLCDCDLRRSEIFDRMRTAFDGGDLAGVNAAGDDLNAEAVTFDTALQTLRGLDTAVGAVPAALPG
jgi:hypothetical protein